MSLPLDCKVESGPKNMMVIRLSDIADKAKIGVYDMQGATGQDMAYLQNVYEESRQCIGITDSFQGRSDPTATSGKAKEFAAAQSAGRLDSKRRMKDAAYGALYEAMFKFKLAYADEPRQVVDQDSKGHPFWDVFNRYDFLLQDEAGEYYWNDQFIFGVDTSGTLASNREAMWQETRMNLTSGAYGDPSDINTLIMFWNQMDNLHYPSAKSAKDFLEERQHQQAMAAAKADIDVQNKLRQEKSDQAQSVLAQQIAGQAAADARMAIDRSNAEMGAEPEAAEEAAPAE